MDFHCDQSQVMTLTRVRALGKSDDMKRRKLGTPKLQGESLEDLVIGWRRAAEEMNGAGIKHKVENEDGEDEERALGQGPLLSALAVWFLNLTPGQRRTVGRVAVAALHELELETAREWQFVMFRECPEESVSIDATESVESNAGRKLRGYDLGNVGGHRDSKSNDIIPPNVSTPKRGK